MPNTAECDTGSEFEALGLKMPLESMLKLHAFIVVR